MSSPAAAAASIIYVGMDVHKDSIPIAVLPMAAKPPTRLERLPNALPKLKRFLDRLAWDGELRCCYEAGGAGYVLHRALGEWGLPLRRDRALAHPEAAGRPAEARQARGRGARPRRRPLPRDVPARGPQVAPPVH